MSYPSDRAGREAARQALVDEAVERAYWAGRLMGLSLKCEAATKVGNPHHDCRNDGSTCLCVCHDPAEAEPSKQDQDRPR